MRDIEKSQAQSQATDRVAGRGTPGETRVEAALKRYLGAEAFKESRRRTTRRSAGKDAER